MSGTLGGVFTGWDFAWVNDPPVRKLTAGKQVRDAVTKMLEVVNAFGGDALAEEDSNSDEIPEAKQWNERFADTRSVLGMVGAGHDLNYAYYLFGAPVGIMCIIDSDPPYIADLVTHPGVENAGGILVEVAASHSESKSQSGKLELYSYNGRSTGAYLALGFVKEDGDATSGGKMTLTPGSSNLWVLVGKKWKLKKYQAKKYYTVRPTPPPKRL